MLRKIINKKLIITSASLFALLLICMIPSNTNYKLENIKSKIEYVNKDINTEEIYLADKNSLLARTKIVAPSNLKTENSRAKYIIESLIKDGPNQSKLPNGFRAVLPNETKLITMSFENGILKINFSKELLDIEANEEEKIIESIVYSATSINTIKQVIIYVDNNVLTLLPKSKTTLPSILDRSFGINKEYKFTNPKNVNRVTVYYIDKFNDNTYYVPVTKYLNDERDKISIIIDELSSTSINTANSSLMSFLNSNAEVLNVNEVNNIIELTFNSYIFDNNESKKILEEVIYTISLSVKDNYNTNEVVFKEGNKEIYKSVLKTIE